MANRMFNQFQGSLEKGVVQLYAEVAFDAGGVATLVRGKGFSGVFQPGAPGGLRLLLQDSYVRLLHLTGSVQTASVAPSATPFVFATSLSNVSAEVPNALVSVVFMNASNVATTPTSTTVFFSVTLSNSTVI